jgi:two-component system chemotaxis response regulator CheY
MTISGYNELPVLIIDDIDSARAVLRDMLSELGFTNFLEARDGREALRILKDSMVQLIFCDNVMEGMSGLEFITALRGLADFTTVPVIFVSAVGEVSTVEEAIENGAADYLVKPISFRKLRRKVEDALRPQTVESQPTAYEYSW